MKLFLDVNHGSVRRMVISLCSIVNIGSCTEVIFGWRKGWDVVVYDRFRRFVHILYAVGLSERRMIRP